jgi:alpha-tubulin suppressor-like RCC1 family protein
MSDGGDGARQKRPRRIAVAFVVLLVAASASAATLLIATAGVRLRGALGPAHAHGRSALVGGTPRSAERARDSGALAGQALGGAPAARVGVAGERHERENGGRSSLEHRPEGQKRTTLPGGAAGALARQGARATGKPGGERSASASSSASQSGGGAALASAKVAYASAPLANRPSTPCPPANRTAAECEVIASALATSSVAGELEGSGPLGGLTPQELRAAYKLPEHGGSGATIAVVDAPGDPNAEADLNIYRSEYGLGSCTEANGCFKQINALGEVKKPTEQGPWEEEISLDLDMVAAACSECHIILVEALSSAPADLLAAEEEAVRLHPTAISNSWNLGFEQGNPANANVECGVKGRCLTGEEEEADNHYFDHPGTPIFFAAGDFGYAVRYPADSPYVIAIGGTTLHKASGSKRGWSEESWFNSKVGADEKGRGGGSGCSIYEAKPAWQHDKPCAKRLIVDAAADANPEVSPVTVYDSYVSGGWLNEGGTSASAPFMAGVWGLSTSYGKGLNALGAEALYLDTGAFFDITVGITGTCTPPEEDLYWCTALPGIDGPTGVGTPDGPLALHGPPTVSTEAPSSVTATEATLNASINPNGLETTYQFEYGTSTSYGGKIPLTPAGAGATASAGVVSATVAGLAPETLYHYRIVATSSAGTSVGAEQSFRTPALPAITNVQPALGPASGGVTVSITGRNLAGALAVDFGSTPARSVSVNSAGFITAVAPAGTGSVEITVKTAAGTSTAVGADRFTYRQGEIVSAWGANQYGQLGNGTSTASDLPVPTGELRGVWLIGGGAFDNLLAVAGGALMGVGDNESGQLGDGTLLSSPTPIEVCASGEAPCASGLSGVSAVAGGHGHSLAIANGKLLAWGYNADGELGDGTTITSDVPVAVGGLSEEAIAVAAGSYFSMALLKGGGVLAWGKNGYGQLGTGNSEGATSPAPVCMVAESPCKEANRLAGVVAVAAGGAHALALLKNGTVLSWGENHYGQVGDGTEQNRSLPVAVCMVSESPCKEEHRLHGVVAIAAGEYDSLALLENGTVMAWGDEEAGQLGSGQSESSALPQPVCDVLESPCAANHQLGEVTAIASGSSHSLALLRSGALLAWGDNESGALGTGTSSGPERCTPHGGGPLACSRVPVAVENISGAIEVAGGQGDSVALARSPAPQIGAITPAEGPAGGGTKITITGTHFTGAKEVLIGSARATSFTVNSPSSITAVVPAGNGTVAVSVIGPGGGSPNTTVSEYRYLIPALQEGLSFAVGIEAGKELSLRVPSASETFSLGALKVQGAVGQTAKIRLESGQATEEIEAGEYVATGQGILAEVEAFNESGGKAMGPVPVACTVPADIVLAELPIVETPGEGSKSYSASFQAECVLFPGGWNVLGSAQVQLSATAPQTVAPGETVQVQGASFTLVLPQAWGEWLYALGDREARGRASSRTSASIAP